MEAATYRPPVLTQVDPHIEWVHGDDFDTLLVDVSGFTKDQLKVQVEPSGSLSISGDRALDGGRQRYHFLKRFDLTADAARDAAAIRVQLDRGVLYVQVPRRLLCSAAAAIGADGAQQQHVAPARYEEVDALRGQDGEEEEAAAIWSGGHTHTAAWRLAARSMSKHRHVVLNVVLAVVLLWLVAFGERKPSGMQMKNE